LTSEAGEKAANSNNCRLSSS